jgi:hypothetical protein
MKHWTQNALMDAALGDLAPAREAELRTHIAECYVCREALASAKVACAAIDRGVEALVSGAPAPQFEARLRVRFATTPAPSETRQPWMRLTPASAVLAAAAFLLLAAHIATIRNHPVARTGTRNQIPSEVAVQPRAPSGNRGENLALAPGTKGTVAPLASHNHLASLARAHREPTSDRRAESEVLVEPGQLEAAMRFVEAARTDPPSGAEVVVTGGSTSESLDIKPIEIRPLEKPPTEDSPDAQGGTGRR